LPQSYLFTAILHPALEKMHPPRSREILGGFLGNFPISERFGESVSVNLFTAYSPESLLLRRFWAKRTTLN
jgi:hypothetical protein